MPTSSLRTRRRPGWPAFLAALLVVIGFLEPTWAVSGPCCAAGAEGECCCEVKLEARAGAEHSCCAGSETPETPSPCDLPGGCSCSFVPLAPTPLFVVPPTLEHGGRSLDALHGWASGEAPVFLEAGGRVALPCTAEDRAPPRTLAGEAPRPRNALRRGLVARLAELSVARL